LFLTFRGIEKTRWTHEAKYEGQKEKQPYGMNTFLDVSQVLHNFESNYLEPGYYSFPFSFMLP